MPTGTPAVLEWCRAPLAAAASVVAGAAQIGWIAAQLAIMPKYNVLQPTMIGFGLAVLLLALWTRRRQPPLGEQG